MNGTQFFVPISDIKDNLIFLKNGGITMILTTSAVNFGLLFETEQISIIESFAGLINSLSFPIQIVIRSKRLDVSSYLTTLDKAAAKQLNPLLKDITIRYRHFVESIIKENNVLDKQFYVCLNVSAAEMGILPKNIADKTKKAQTVLNPRRDHLLRQLTRLGLKAKQLETIELIKLFYDVYNNGVTANLPAATETTTTPQVNTIVSPPKPTPTITSNFTLRRLPVRPAGLPMLVKPIIAYRPPVPNIPAAPLLHTFTPPFVVEELADDFGP